MNIRVAGIILFASVLSAFAISDDEPYFQYVFGVAHHPAVALADKAQNELDSGDLPAARRDADAIMRIDPGFWLALYIRAEVSIQEHKWNSVIADCSAGLKQEPTFLEFAIFRAMANDAMGKYAAGFAELDHVIGLHPGRASALSLALEQRAWARVTCSDSSYRNPRKAIADAKQACNLLYWKFANGIDTLACAYADAGDFDNAIQTEERVMNAKGASKMQREVQAHMALFKQHRTVRSLR